MVLILYGQHIQASATHCMLHKYVTWFVSNSWVSCLFSMTRLTSVSWCWYQKCRKSIRHKTRGGAPGVASTAISRLAWQPNRNGTIKCRHNSCPLALTKSRNLESSVHITFVPEIVEVDQTTLWQCLLVVRQLLPQSELVRNWHRPVEKPDSTKVHHQT